MKTLLWKIRYAIYMRKLTRMPWRECWEYAGSWLEMVNGDLTEAEPYQAVEEEMYHWGD